jgi:hypothetical protein
MLSAFELVTLTGNFNSNVSALLQTLNQFYPSLVLVSL